MNREATIRAAESNRSKLEPVRALLRTDMAVPLKTAPAWVDAHEQDIKSLKRLAVALGIEARAQELAGNTNGAGGTLVDLIYLGQAMRRGGVYVDAVNGLVVETIGVGTLRPKVRFLDGAACRGAVRELEALEANREPAGTFLEREQAWSRASFGLVSRTMTWFGRKADAERSAKFRQKFDESTSRVQRLLLVLAARALEVETGRRVENPADLVPGVLRTVPVDPKTKQPASKIPALDVDA
jgi:hypothetical protein